MEFAYGEEINNLMAEYARGTNRILARERWFLPAELGGYGLVNVHTLSTGIKAAWVKRWIMESEINPDYTGEKVRSGQTVADRIGCSERVHGRTIGLCEGTVLKEWNKFKKCFYLRGENVLKALLFGNSGIASERSDFIETIVFSRERYEEIQENLQDVRVGELIGEGGCIDKRETERVLGVRINMAEYFRLRERIEWINTNYVQRGKEGKGLTEFMRKKGNGCGKYREVMEGIGSRWYVEKDPRNMPSLRTLLGENVLELDRRMVELNVGLWKTGQLSAQFKDFLFKMVQGRLYLNAILANFTDERPGCTFCYIFAKRELREREIDENRPEYEYYLGLVPAENINHLFWECEHVQPIIQESYRYLKNIQDQEFGGDIRLLSKETFFRGEIRSCLGKAKAEIIAYHFIKYFINECRLKHIMPTFLELRREFEYLVEHTRNAKQWGRYIGRSWEIYE
jgi:hypothetical protein